MTKSTNQTNQTNRTPISSLKQFRETIKTPTVAGISIPVEIAGRTINFTGALLQSGMIYMINAKFGDELAGKSVDESSIGAILDRWSNGYFAIRDIPKAATALSGKPAANKIEFGRQEILGKLRDMCPPKNTTEGKAVDKYIDLLAEKTDEQWDKIMGIIHKHQDTLTWQAIAALREERAAEEKAEQEALLSELGDVLKPLHGAE